MLALRGFYPEAMLETYGQDGGLFAEHPPAPADLPGIEAATGSLGHGLPIGLGMALSARIQGRRYNVVALLSDGECNEGSVWEAAMMAASQKDERLAIIVDFNKWQATGRSEEVLALTPLADKWRAFGWEVFDVDGHDMEKIVDALDRAETVKGRPAMIVCRTVKGKGSKVFEGKVDDVSVGAFRSKTKGFERDWVTRAPTFYTSELFLRRDGKLPATWEVITAHAWGPPPGAPIRVGGVDEVRVPVSAIPVRRR